MPRPFWKGAIAFGLVHVPVALYPASRADDIDFDWLDRRSMDPVGYQRINKRTGRAVPREDIVKGVKQSDDSYVVLDDAEIREAYPRTLQTIEIEAFVKIGEIPFPYYEQPYYLAPDGKAAKVYALLREAMVQARVVGIARVVLRTKEHLAALIPAGPALMLDTLRWLTEIRSPDELKLPPAGRGAAGLKEAELKMAGQLIDELTMPWKPDRYHDRFTEEILRLVAAKAAAGKGQRVEPVEAPPESGSNVLDLTALLRQSLKAPRTASGTGRGGASAADGKDAAKTAGTTTPRSARASGHAAPVRTQTARAATKRAASADTPAPHATKAKTTARAAAPARKRA